MKDKSKTKIYAGIAVAVIAIIAIVTIALVVNNNKQETQDEHLQPSNTKVSEQIVDWNNATKVTGEELKTLQEAFQNDVTTFFGENEKISDFSVTAAPSDLTAANFDDEYTYQYKFKSSSFDEPLELTTFDSIRQNYIFHWYMDKLIDQYTEELNAAINEKTSGVTCMCRSSNDEPTKFGHIPTLDEIVESGHIQCTIYITIDENTIVGMDSMDIIDKAHDQLRTAMDVLTITSPAFKNITFSVCERGTSTNANDNHRLCLSIAPASKEITWCSRTDNQEAEKPTDLTYERALE